MELSIIELENLISVEYSNDKILFFKNAINIIFFYNNTYDKLVLNNTRKLKDFEIKKNNSIKYFIIIYEFNDDEELLKYFKNNFDFNFFNYVNLNMYWCSLIYRDKEVDYIYEENIFTELYEKKHINLIINVESYDTNKYINIEKQLNSFENEINNFSDDLKNISLKEINNRKQRIYLLYNNLEKYIENIETKYEIISKKIKTKMEDIKKINVNISKIQNKETSSIDIMLQEKNNYLVNLLNIIEITEEKKNKSLTNLNTINSLIKNKENNISLLEKELLDLKNTKVSYYKEISKLKNRNENKNQTTRNLAVMVHIYNLSIWDDIYSYIKNLGNIEFDLYVNLASSDENNFQKLEYRNFINKLSKINICQNFYLTFSDNRGLDIGGFIISYTKMIDLGLNYNSIIKIHTKSNDNWRFAMLYALLGTESIINNNLDLIKKEKVGMIGNDLIPLLSIVNKNSFRFISVYMNIFNVQFNNRGHFVPGTIFWIKGSILKHYFNKKNLNTCYNSFQKDYCGSKENRREGRPHAFERFFGMLVESNGKNSVRFDSNPQDYI